MIKNLIFGIIGLSVGFLIQSCATTTQKKAEAIVEKEEIQLAQKPPMGWNSYNCFGGNVKEAEVKANADYMAEKL